MATQTLEERLQGRARFSERTRALVQQDINSTGPTDTTNQSFRIKMYATSICRRYAQSNPTEQPIAMFEWDLHDIWHTVIQTALVLGAHEAAQDRLVATVLYIRNLGTLCRVSDKMQEALTSDGRMWTDLPFFVPAVKETYLTLLETSPSFPAYLHAKENLSAFVARLVGAGIKSRELADCALFDFVSPLEQTPDDDDEGRARLGANVQQGLEVEDSGLLVELPIVNCWLQYARHALVQLIEYPDAERTSFVKAEAVDEGDDETSVEAVFQKRIQPTRLAREAGVLRPGWTVERWRLWEARVGAFKHGPNEDVKKLAARAGHMMYFAACEVPSAVFEVHQHGDPRVNVGTHHPAPTD